MNSALEIVIFIIQVLLGFVLVYGMYLLYRFYKSYKYDKRFGPFTAVVLEGESDSLFDSINYFYIGLRNKLSKVFIKSKLLVDYSKKYERYSDNSRVSSIELMHYISNKFLIGIGLVLLLIFTGIFKLVKVDVNLLLFVFLIGFFILDIYLMIVEKVKLKQIERDMGKAIIIMNNAFKSGYSIMQALYLVYTEMDGPISVEFKKMYMDITFGLNMEVVFNRFADRVKTVEASFMATSLSVLNKTGGNIVLVFNSVERSLMMRKKLKDELEASSASSRAMFKMLICIPIFLVLILGVLSPTYFIPLFTNPLGIMCLVLSILIYILYIIIIRKIVYIEVKL